MIVVSNTSSVTGMLLPLAIVCVALLLRDSTDDTPTGPVGPAGPVWPVEPVEPVEPVRPVGPCAPAPVAPVRPVGPIWPRPNGIPADQSPDVFVFLIYNTPLVVSKNANPAG